MARFVIILTILLVGFSCICFGANLESEYPSAYDKDVEDAAFLPNLLPLKRTTRQVYRRPAPFIAGAAVGRLTSPYRYAAIASSPSYYYPTYYSPYYYGR